MAALSRWSGGLIDRFGARLPLIVGPTIAAVGFLLLAMPGAARSYLALLAPMSVLGVGMVVTVAPLTTSVINAVPERQAGTASGINNAIASLASLLAVAILGAVALDAHNRALNRELASPTLPSEVRQAVSQARGKFAADVPLQGEKRIAAQTIVRRSLGDGIRIALWIAAALTLLAALAAALTIPPRHKTEALEAKTAPG